MVGLKAASAIVLLAFVAAITHGQLESEYHVMNPKESRDAHKVWDLHSIIDVTANLHTDTEQFVLEACQTVRGETYCFDVARLSFNDDKDGVILQIASLERQYIDVDGNYSFKIILKRDAEGYEVFFPKGPSVFPSRVDYYFCYHQNQPLSFRFRGIRRAHFKVIEEPVFYYHIDKEIAIGRQYHIKGRLENFASSMRVAFCRERASAIDSEWCSSPFRPLDARENTVHLPVFLEKFEINTRFEMNITVDIFGYRVLTSIEAASQISESYHEDTFMWSEEINSLAIFGFVKIESITSEPNLQPKPSISYEKIGHLEEDTLVGISAFIPHNSRSFRIALCKGLHDEDDCPLTVDASPKHGRAYFNYRQDGVPGDARKSEAFRVTKMMVASGSIGMITIAGIGFQVTFPGLDPIYFAHHLDVNDAQYVIISGDVLVEDIEIIAMKRTYNTSFRPHPADSPAITILANVPEDSTRFTIGLCHDPDYEVELNGLFVSVDYAFGRMAFYEQQHGHWSPGNKDVANPITRGINFTLQITKDLGFGYSIYIDDLLDYPIGLPSKAPWKHNGVCFNGGIIVNDVKYSTVVIPGNIRAWPSPDVNQNPYGVVVTANRLEPNPENPERFLVALCSGPDAEDDCAIAMLISFKYNAIAFNSRTGGISGKFELVRLPEKAFDRGNQIQIRIDITTPGYKIYVDDVYVHEFQYRLPLSNTSVVQSFVNVEDVVFNPKVVDPEMCSENPCTSPPTVIAVPSKFSRAFAVTFLGHPDGHFNLALCGETFVSGGCFFFFSATFEEGKTDYTSWFRKAGVYERVPAANGPRPDLYKSIRIVVEPNLIMVTTNGGDNVLSEVIYTEYDLNVHFIMYESGSTFLRPPLFRQPPMIPMAVYAAPISMDEVVCIESKQSSALYQRFEVSLCDSRDNADNCPLVIRFHSGRFFFSSRRGSRLFNKQHGEVWPSERDSPVHLCINYKPFEFQITEMVDVTFVNSMAGSKDLYIHYWDSRGDQNAKFAVDTHQSNRNFTTIPRVRRLLYDTDVVLLGSFTNESDLHALPSFTVGLFAADAPGEYCLLRLDVSFLYKVIMFDYDKHYLDGESGHVFLHDVIQQGKDFNVTVRVDAFGYEVSVNNAITHRVASNSSNESYAGHRFYVKYSTGCIAIDHINILRPQPHVYQTHYDIQSDVIQGDRLEALLYVNSDCHRFLFGLCQGAESNKDCSLIIETDFEVDRTIVYDRKDMSPNSVEYVLDAVPFRQGETETITIDMIDGYKIAIGDVTIHMTSDLNLDCMRSIVLDGDVQFRGHKFMRMAVLGKDAKPSVLPDGAAKVSPLQPPAQHTVSQQSQYELKEGTLHGNENLAWAFESGELEPGKSIIIRDIKSQFDVDIQQYSEAHHQFNSVFSNKIDLHGLHHRYGNETFEIKVEILRDRFQICSVKGCHHVTANMTSVLDNGPLWLLPGSKAAATYTSMEIY